MYLSWIIPAYNEERRIEKTLREVDVFLRSQNFVGGYEIVVADSASRDATQEIVKKMSAEIPELRLFNVESKGKGLAVKKAMLNAKGEIRLFSDADNSTAPDNFLAMRELFSKGNEVVISSRDHKDASGAARDIKEPWHREIIGNVGNIIIQLFGGVWGIWDTQNGFKALSAKAAEDIFSRSLMSGFSFDIEMLALARRLNYKIAIIPIRWKFDPDSKVTPADYFKVFADVFKIRWNLIWNKYHV